MKEVEKHGASKIKKARTGKNKKWKKGLNQEIQTKGSEAGLCTAKPKCTSFIHILKVRQNSTDVKILRVARIFRNANAVIQT